MNLPRAILVTLVLAVLVTMHFTLRPLLDLRAGVDFLVIGVLVVAVRVRPATAAVVGFLLGLTVDAMAPDALGAASLAMTLTGFGASRLKAAFFADNLGLLAGFVFLGKLFFDVVSILAGGQLGGMTLVWQLLAWTPLSALVTAVVGIIVMAIVRPALDRRQLA